jgi:hypothetical protein
MTSDSSSVGRDRLGKLSGGVELSKMIPILVAGCSDRSSDGLFAAVAFGLEDPAMEGVRCVQEHLQGRECDAGEM